MPVQHQVSEYPSSFFSAFSHPPLTIQCETRHEASALRQQLYAFRRALRRSPDHLDLSLQADATVICLIGPKLRIEPKRHNLGGDLITEALENTQ